MYILDTDVLGFFLSTPHPHLLEKIRDAESRRLLYISVISVGEMMAGVISQLLNKDVQKDSTRLIEAYYYVQKLSHELKRFRVLPFDERAVSIFQDIPRTIVSGNVNDCRIAAIALLRNFTVVTNNSTDFDVIAPATGVKVEYWARTPLPRV